MGANLRYNGTTVYKEPALEGLTHWGRVTHIRVSKLTIIASDNGLSPGRCQAIIWASAGILLIGPLGANFSQISIEILTFSFKKMRLKVSSAKRQPFCLGLNGLKWLGWFLQHKHVEQVLEYLKMTENLLNFVRMDTAYHCMGAYWRWGSIGLDYGLAQKICGKPLSKWTLFLWHVCRDK